MSRTPADPPPEAADAAGPLTAEQLTQLKAQAREAEQYRDRWLRLQAEFENTRKRMRRERLEFEARAAERVLTDLLGMVDDFERAVAAASADMDPDHLKTGIRMVYQRSLDLLKAHGVEPMDAVGQPFDPGRHEAVGQVETTDQPEATVVEELRKGYVLHGRVIRPATVRVAIRKAAENR